MSRRDEVTALITDHKRYLFQLELRKAREGFNTPPHVLMEIEDRQRAIAELQQELASLPPKAESAPAPQLDPPQADPPAHPQQDPPAPQPDPLLQPDPLAPTSARQPAPPAVAPDPSPAQTPGPPPVVRVPDLIERIQRTWLVAYAIAWLVFALLVMAALSEAFGPSQCVQRLVYALLALGGGLAILGLSLLPAYLLHYRWLDRLLTLLATLAAAGLAAYLAYGACLPAAPAASSTAITTTTPSALSSTAPAPAAGLTPIAASAASAPPAATEIPTALPAPDPSGKQLPGEITITSASDGQSMADEQVISGAYANLPADHTIWVLVHTNWDKWFPQSSDACAGLHTVADNGLWQVTANFRQGYPSEPYTVIVVVADPAADSFLDQKQQEWCKQALDSPDFIWPGLSITELPAGISEKDRVQVTHQ